VDTPTDTTADFEKVAAPGCSRSRAARFRAAQFRAAQYRAERSSAASGRGAPSAERRRRSVRPFYVC